MITACSVPAFAGMTMTLGDLTLERTTANIGGLQQDTWKVTGYSGSGGTVDIPDGTADEDISTVNASNINTLITSIDTGVFSGNDKITSIRLPQYLLNIQTDAFEDMPALTEFSGTSKYFTIDDGVLYYGPKLFNYPDGKTGSYTIKDGTTALSSAVFKNATIDTLVVPSTVVIRGDDYPFAGSKINTLELNSSNIDDKSLCGGDINNVTGANSSNGSAVIGGKLYYWGRNHAYDLSTCTAISSYAFLTDDDYNAGYSKLTDAVKTNKVFVIYNGIGSVLDSTDKQESHKRSYFMVNGKTSFCYDFGLTEPESVKSSTDYTAEIETNSDVYNKIRAVLYAGAPNNGTGLFESVFGVPYNEFSYSTGTDVAKNVTGALVWEIRGNAAATADRINGVGTGVFTTEKVNQYIEALRTKCIDNASTLNLDSFSLTFYKTEDAAVQNLVALKKTIFLSKKIISTSDELPGAALTLTKDGTVIKSWTSTTTPYAISDIEDGTYVLTETTAPAGYKTAESITFTVTDEKVDGGNEVTMYDSLLDKTFTISKQDATTKEELAGATLTLTQGSTVIDTWTSTTTPHVMTNLPDGKYTLTETTAPSGYKTAESITFTVTDGTVSTPVVMYDKAKTSSGTTGGSSSHSSTSTSTTPHVTTPTAPATPTTQTPTPSAPSTETQKTPTAPAPEGPRTPVKTGDVAALFILANMIGSGIAFELSKKKKK